MRKIGKIVPLAVMAFCVMVALWPTLSHVSASVHQAAIQPVDCNALPSHYVKLVDENWHSFCYAKEGPGQETIDLSKLLDPIKILASVGYPGTFITSKAQPSGNFCVSNNKRTDFSGLITIISVPGGSNLPCSLELGDGPVF